jgi:UDP:flavonoid glycosyltransferase YjiC (YdhE family)
MCIGGVRILLFSAGCANDMVAGMRVLFTATSGWGHIHPMVPLARALVDRGDEVLWATGADGCERLAREGFKTAPAGLADREAMAEFYRRFPEVKSVPPPQRSDFMFPRLFGLVRFAPMLADLARVAKTWSPALVVCDAGEFAGHLQAAALGVPSVTHSFGALLPEPRVAATAAAVAPLWIERGLEPRAHGGMYERLYIDIYPASLQPGDRAHVPRTQRLRPGSFATAGDEKVPEWVASSAPTPLVYVTFGTVFSNNEALSSIIEAVRELPVRVVVTVGPRSDPAAVGAQPDNVHVARYIPQDQLLAHCAVVISHGGSGTLLASLAAGIPQLCVPQGADQFFNAAACERSCSGLALQPGAVSVDSVRTAVGRLLSDAAFRSAAMRVSAEIAAMPAPDEVADRLHAEF